MILIFLLLSSLALPVPPVRGCQWPCEGYEEDCLDSVWICDNFAQCWDDWDEGKEAGQGCNLYPESGCLSQFGREHFKCERTGECFQTSQEAAQCDRTDSASPTSRSCRLEGGEGWRCSDGRCIPSREVCDGQTQCEDGSDEGREGTRVVTVTPSSLESPGVPPGSVSATSPACWRRRVRGSPCCRSARCPGWLTAAVLRSAGGVRSQTTGGVTTAGASTGQTSGTAGRTVRTARTR